MLDTDEYEYESALATLITSRSLPHLTEFIFLKLLSFQDLISCMRVSARWRRSLVSTLLMSSPLSRRILESKRLAYTWGSSNRLRWSDFDDINNVSFVDCSSNIVIMSTKHGQKRCTIYLLNTSGRIIHSLDKEFPFSIVHVQTSKEFIFIFLADNSVMTLNRQTLEEEVGVEIQRGTKRFIIQDAEVLSLKKLGQDFMLLRLSRISPSGSPQILRMKPLGLVESVFPHDCDPKGRQQKVVGSKLIMACRHGVLQMFDFKKGQTLWATKGLSYAADRLRDLLVSTWYAAVVYSTSDSSSVANLHSLNSGDLLKTISFSDHSPVVAASESFFVYGIKEANAMNELMLHIYSLCGSSSSSEFIRVRTSVGSGLQRAKIHNDRLLLLQSFLGQPRQRAGELKIFDLMAKAEDIRVLKGLHYSGPLNQNIYTMISDYSLMVLRESLGGQIRLSIVTFTMDSDIEEIFSSQTE